MLVRKDEGFGRWAAKDLRPDGFRAGLEQEIRVRPAYELESVCHVADERLVADAESAGHRKRLPRRRLGHVPTAVSECLLHRYDRHQQVPREGINEELVRVELVRVPPGVIF